MTRFFVDPSRALLLALAVCASARSASAQLVSYTSRIGQNTVYCGIPGGGPVIQHTFLTAAATHDSISVSDPGSANTPPSSGTSNLDAAPAPSGISLAQSGSAMRGALTGTGNGVYAVGDARDSWEFDITAPTRFTFSASLSASSTEASVPTQAYQFGALGGGGQVIPDPGTPPGTFSSFITAPGALSATGAGTLTPGHYFVTLFGRAEGNTFPYSGSFSHSLALGLGCGVATSYCTSGTTTHGCTAQIQGNGTASASAASGFTLDVTSMEGASQGLIFYGVSGRAASPWGTSSSFVCVKSPTQRTGAQSGGGTAGACDGALSLDWNSFVASHPGALGAPFSVGQLVQAQGWFRDPPSPKSTMLTDAVEFAVCP